MLSCRTMIPTSLSVSSFIKHIPYINKKPKFNIIKKNLTVSAFGNNNNKSTLFETLSHAQKQQVETYVDTLLEWNQKMNLTAVRDESEVMKRHIEDSLAIIPPIKSSYVAHCEASCEKISVVDVGSGAGLPGLILAIACPGWKVTLLESMNKRCVFLEHAIDVTQLSNVQVIRDRAENLGQNLAFREGFDVAVARAVAELRTLAEYCLPLVRVGGLFVAAKGHDPQEEVTGAEKAIHLMGASTLQMCSVESNGPYGQRTAVVCLKNSPTPRRYPREPGTPAKSPL